MRRAELIADRFSFVWPDMAERRIASEEDQIRHEPVFLVHLPEVPAQRLQNAMRVPTGVRSASVQVGQMQPSDRAGHGGRFETVRVQVDGWFTANRRAYHVGSPRTAE